MAHSNPNDETRARAELYTLGQLSAEEASAFITHLREPCAVCLAEVARMEEIVAGLALTVPPVAPPPALKDRLFAAIRGQVDPERSAPADSLQVWRRWRQLPEQESLLVRAGDDGFERTAVAGVHAKRLSVDVERDQVVMLVRMEAGASYPRHRHAGVEECYVLEGDLWHEDRVMRAGDYERVTEGSRHSVQSTEGGCLLLIHSSLNDELF